MPRTLEVSELVQLYEADGPADGFRLRLEITDATEMSRAVFRYFRRPPAPGDVEPHAYTDGVCSSLDFQELPENEPAASDPLGRFRLPYLDVVLPSRVVADQTSATLREHIDALIDSLNAQDQIEARSSYTLSGRMA